MRRQPLGLILAGLLAAPAAAASTAPSASAVEAAASRPDPGLLRLDQELAVREQGRAAPDVDAQFLVRFRAELDAARAQAAPTPANAALYARILAELGDAPPSGPEPAPGAARPTLKEPPAIAASYAALERLRLDVADSPAAFDGTRKTPSADRGAPAAPIQAFVPRSPQRMRAADPDTKMLPYRLAVKLTPAAPPPDLAAATPASSGKSPGPLPLLSLAGAAGLGLMGFGVSRSAGTFELSDGLDDAHPQPGGPGQRLVANAALATLAVGALFVASPIVDGIAPAVLARASLAASGSLRLLASEEGAINPDAVPKAGQLGTETEAAAADAEQIVVKKGEVLNRVWHSEWGNMPEASGPKGQSYCRGDCLPIHAADAIERRGLNAPGVLNNARHGGIFSVTEDVVATVRQAIGGIEQEILLHPSDLHKLEEVSRSNLPPGGK